MTVKLLTEHHLDFLSLKVGCTGSSESTLVKMPHCWKSHVTAHTCVTNEPSHEILVVTALSAKKAQANLGIAQTCQSICCSHTQIMDVVENSIDPDMEILFISIKL